MRVLLSIFVVALAHAQHHFPDVDPFAYSGCNCSAFCDGQCAINATGAANTTLYRMTPHHTLSLLDKNTGDMAGDTSYIISRRTAAFDCRNAPPSDTHCATMTVTGDVANSTDLIIEFKVEVDGNWGPYLYCNPLDGKKPEGEWNCSASHHGVTPHTCDCPQSYKAVGRMNLTTGFGPGGLSMHPAGGEWYSTSHQGQCAPGAALGTDGCSWREVERTRVVNSSCVYGRLDAYVESKNTSCFADCPRLPASAGFNKTTVCYSECFSHVTRAIPHKDLVQPWVKAFGSKDAAVGGCPEVTL